MACPKFSLDEVVFAKLKGWPPWPAKVEFFENIPSNNKVKYNVYFYGTNQIAQCKEDDLFPYLANRDKLGKPKKAKGFDKAILQADLEVKRQGKSPLTTNQLDSHLDYLEVELKVLKIDKEIKNSLNYNNPCYDTCLRLLGEYFSLNTTPLMFIKNPLLIDTLLKLQVYSADSTNVSSGHDEFKMYLIRKKANSIYKKVKSIFNVPRGKQFLELFSEKLTEFNKFVKNMTEDEVLKLSRDPTTTEDLSKM